MILQKNTINFYLCRNCFPNLSQKLRSAWLSVRNGAKPGGSGFVISFLRIRIYVPNVTLVLKFALIVEKCPISVFADIAADANFHQNFSDGH